LKLNLELSPGLVVTYAIVQPVPAGNGLKVTLVFGSRLRLGGFRIVEGRRGPVLLPPAVKTAGGKWVELANMPMVDRQRVLEAILEGLKAES